MSLLCAAGLPTSILTWLLIREKKQAAKLLEQQATTLRGVQLRQLDILEKSFAQLRAADVWQYQAIQAVNAPSQYDETSYDPSEEGEARRIAERDNNVDEWKEGMNAQEAAALDALFPGFSGGI